MAFSSSLSSWWTRLPRSRLPPFIGQVGAVWLSWDSKMFFLDVPPNEMGLGQWVSNAANRIFCDCEFNNQTLLFKTPLPLVAAHLISSISISAPMLKVLVLLAMLEMSLATPRTIKINRGSFIVASTSSVHESDSDTRGTPASSSSPAARSPVEFSPPPSINFLDDNRRSSALQSWSDMQTTCLSMTKSAGRSTPQSDFKFCPFANVTLKQGYSNSVLGYWNNWSSLISSPSPLAFYVEGDTCLHTTPTAKFTTIVQYDCPTEQQDAEEVAATFSIEQSRACEYTVVVNDQRACSALELSQALNRRMAQITDSTATRNGTVDDTINRLMAIFPSTQILSATTDASSVLMRWLALEFKRCALHADSSCNQLLSE